MFAGSASFYYGLGSFFKPVVDEFGWSYAQTAFVLSIYQVEGGLMAPLVGFLFDRFGPRRLIMLGGFLLGVGFMLMSRVDSFTIFFASVLVMSVGFSTGFAGIGMATLANWFARRLTLAMGVCFIGGGAGGVLVPALVWSIGQWGWRPTALATGFLVWLVVIPLAQLVSHRPEQRGLRMDGASPGPAPSHLSKAGKASPPLVEVGVGVREALRTRSFWMLTLISGLSFAANSALVVHQIPFLVSIGMTPQQGGFVLALMTLVSLPGRVGFGWLADRWSRRHTLALVFVLQGLGVLAFAFANNPLALITYLVIYGPAMGGGVPLRPSLQAELFGRRSFGSIQGIIQGLAGTAGIAGPVYAGWMYDVGGGYQTAFVLLAVTIIVGIIPTMLVAPVSQQTPAAAVPETVANRA